MSQRRRSPRPWRTAVRVVIALSVGVSMATLSPPPASAQVDLRSVQPGETLYEIQLVDGSVLFARVTSVEGDTIVVTTSGGARVELAIGQIREARPARGSVVDGEFRRVDRSDSRLFFTATGRTLDRGEAYVGTYLIVLPFVGVGVTDRLTLAAGAPVLLGEIEPFYFAPKLQVLRTARAQLSFGALHFALPDDDEDVGIVYGVGTIGSDDSALTLGLGFGYAGDDFSSQPVAMIGGEVRSGRTTKWMTENYFLPGETGAILSGGVRFIGERFSADLGVAGALGDGGECCLPLVNVSYSFGNR